MYNKRSTIMVIKIEVTRLIPLISEGGISNMLRQFRYEKMTTHKWNHSMIQANVLFVNIVKHYQEPRQDLPGCCLLKGWEAFGWNAPNFSRSNFLRYLRSERVSWRKNIVYVYIYTFIINLIVSIYILIIILIIFEYHQYCFHRSILSSILSLRHNSCSLPSPEFAGYQGNEKRCFKPDEPREQKTHHSFPLCR